MLERLEVAVAGPSLAMFLDQRVEPWLRERAERRFAGEGDDVVGAWAPLKAYTQAVRQAAGYGPEHPINKRTGELERYITQGNNKQTFSNLEASLTMPGAAGTTKVQDKLKTAQGGKALPRTVARPVLGMNHIDMIEVLSTLGGYLTDRVSAP